MHKPLVLPEITPSLKVQIEIDQMIKDPSFQELVRIGGTLTPQEEAENRAIRQKRYACRIKIIRQHGAQAYFLPALKAEQARLQKRLAEVDREVRDLGLDG